MKKTFSKILVLVLVIAIVCSIAVVFTACGESKGGVSKKGAATIKVGLICLHDSSSTYDKNFIDALDVAVNNLKEYYNIETVVKTGVEESDACYEAAADMVDQGCNVIFADSFGHENFMIQAAKDFPNVVFCHATGTQAHTAGLDNFYNAFASIYEGRYLAGVAAGMKLAAMGTTNHKIGYVGAYTYAEVISGYTSFYLGVKSIVPDVTMDVKFTGSWYDPKTEKEAAQALIADGCVLISQHADSMGAPSACEEAGVPNITYNISTKSSCPTTYVVASRINWAPYYEYIIKQTLKGKDIDRDYVGTLASGSVETLEIGDAAAPGTAAALATVKAQLEAGTLKVFDCANFTVDGQHLTAYNADVNTDADFTPDTQVITNGIFEESKFRSAPYFDVKIDGITLKNSAF